MQYPTETEPTSAVLVVGTAAMKEGGASVAHHLPLQAVHWNWLALQSLSLCLFLLNCYYVCYTFIFDVIVF